MFLQVLRYLPRNSTAVLFFFLLSCSHLEDLDIHNYNSPNQKQVYSNTEDFPRLLSGAYCSWYNHCIGPSPAFALLSASEIMTTGYGSWGASSYARIPREQVPNTDSDPVLSPPAASWFGMYQAVPPVNNILQILDTDQKRVIIGDCDFTESCRAHAYLLQGLIYGHLALLHDKAFLVTEHTLTCEFDYHFTPYGDLMEYAVSRIDKAIAICNSSVFTDPLEMLPEVRFNNISLAEFANSMAARLLACNARNETETLDIDWNRVSNYARAGLISDFLVRVKEGWKGIVINRDPWGIHTILEWDWLRVDQKIVSMMAPMHENAAYPWPYNVPRLGPVVSPDARFASYFEYRDEIPWAKYATSKGYHILSHYRHSRFRTLYDKGVGYICFFSRREIDLLLSEALIRTGIDRSTAVELINYSRVQVGGMPPASESETNAGIIEKLYYERFVELMMTYPLLGYFDRRRTDTQSFRLLPGTVRHLPVPYKELILHGLKPYSFGGILNEM